MLNQHKTHALGVILDGILDSKILFYISEGLGYIGVVLILLSYWMLQNNRFPRDLLGYSVMNLIGALLVIISLCFTPNTSALIIEGAWVIMSAIAIVKALRERAQSKPQQVSLPLDD